MAPKVVDYYLTVTSPWTYLGHAEFSAMVKESGAKVNVKAVDLGAVFQVSGGLPLPKRSAQRQRYRLFELQRWRRRRDIPLNVHPAHFPADQTLGNKAVLAAAEMGNDAMAFAGELMRGIWCEDRNVADPAYISEAAAAVGITGEDLVAKAKSDEIAALYQKLTEEAKDAQVFGAPTYIINGESWWGQDRLDFVREVLLEGQETLPDIS